MATPEQEVQQRTQAIQKTQREPVPFAPRSFDDGWRQAQALARSPLIPPGLKVNGDHDATTANVMVLLMWGHELGVSPVQSLFSIHVIKGRPAVSAALKVGLVKQSSECLYFQCVESTATQATWETHRKGNAKPTRITYTAEQAKRAGLLGRQTRSGEDDNWTKWTETMLRWRAGAMLADAEYPDVTRGLGTSDERPQEEAPSFSAIPETRPVDVPSMTLSEVRAAPTEALNRPMHVLPEPQPARTLESQPTREAVFLTREGVRDSEGKTLEGVREQGGTVPRMTLEEAQNAPAGSFPRGEVRITDLPQEARPDETVDPVQAEALAIIEISELETLTTRELDGLVERGMKLPDGALKQDVSKALRAASKRIKGGGAK